MAEYKLREIYLGVQSSESLFVCSFSMQCVIEIQSIRGASALSFTFIVSEEIDDTLSKVAYNIEKMDCITDNQTIMLNQYVFG